MVVIAGQVLMLVYMDVVLHVNSSALLWDSQFRVGPLMHRILKIECLCMCNWEEHLNDQFSEFMWETANFRADWCCRPVAIFWTFVNFSELFT